MQRQRRARLTPPLPCDSHPERQRRGRPHAWHTARGPRSPGGWHPGTKLLRCQYLYFCTRKASRLRQVERFGDARECLAADCIRLHTSAYVSRRSSGAWLRRQTAYVCIRVHTCAYVYLEAAERCFNGRLYTSAYVCIRQLTSAYVYLEAAERCFNGRLYR